MTVCEPSSGGNILCVRLSGLGDIVHAMNALTALRSARPNAHVTWVVEERFEGLLENHPYIDTLFTIPRNTWSRQLRNPLEWGEMVPDLADVMLALRRQSFDVSLDFQSSLKSTWIVGCAGADLRVGFAPPVGREHNWLVQNELVQVPEKGCHRIERDLALLGALGISTRYAAPNLPCGESYKEAVRWVCADLSRPLVVMHPGTSDFASFKRWVPERYGRVARRLMEEKGAGVLVTFGPGEEALAHRLVSASSHRAVLAPRLPHLQQLTYLLSQAELFIGSDTGPMHLASALGVPVLALFGPKEVEGTGPYCSRAEVLTADVDCRPCEKRQCDDPICMTRISENKVYEAAVGMLNGGGSLRGRKGRGINKPFSVEFDLGPWEGELATCYSFPEFYRFLSDQAGISRPGPERFVENPPGECPSLFVRCREVGDDWNGKLDGLFVKASLRNHWEKSRMLWWNGFTVPFPVAWMRGRGKEVFLGHYPAGCSEIVHDGMNRERKVRLQRALHRLHARNVYHLGLDRAGAFGFDDEGNVVLDRLGRARQSWLPPVLRDIVLGLELKRLRSGTAFLRGGTEARQFVESYTNDASTYRACRRLIKWMIGL
ncbi:MAG: glycosyltransferase family 9 protein [Candidatus Brocadiia bacterium]